MGRDKIEVSTPARICLLGEHQDYFGLGVIPAAINLRLVISGLRIDRDSKIKVKMPDIEAVDELQPNEPAPYRRQRDYLRSVYNVLLRGGYRFDGGWDCEVKSQIPIGKGISSSSALVIAWARLLSEIAVQGTSLGGEELANLGYQAEVVEFDEPGGMMDHYACALGGIIHVDCSEIFKVTRLNARIDGLVLGDSLTTKDTTGMLAEIKRDVLQALDMMQKMKPEFSLSYSSAEEAIEDLARLPLRGGRRLVGTMMTRQITKQGLDLLSGCIEPDREAFADLLNRQHVVIRDWLGISTERIEMLISASMKAGALACKLNGSGGGGCFTAYAPGNEASVVEAIKRAGGNAKVVRIDDGTRLEE